MPSQEQPLELLQGQLLGYLGLAVVSVSMPWCSILELCRSQISWVFYHVYEDLNDAASSAMKDVSTMISSMAAAHHVPQDFSKSD